MVRPLEQVHFFKIIRVFWEDYKKPRVFPNEKKRYDGKGVGKFNLFFMMIQKFYDENQLASTHIQFLKGMGPLCAKNFIAQGMKSWWDMVCHIPSKYIGYTSDLPWAVSFNGDPLKKSDHAYEKSDRSMVWGKDGRICVQLVVKCTTISAKNKAWHFLCEVAYPDDHQHKITMEKAKITLIFFHKPRFLITAGSLWHVRGELSITRNGMEIVHPHMIIPLQQAKDQGWLKRTILPVYILPKGISVIRFSQWIRLILASWSENNPKIFTSFPGGLTRKKAFEIAHFPVELDDTHLTSNWRSRLACDEAVALQLSHHALHALDTKKALPCMSDNQEHEQQFLSNFGHCLTPSQHRAWDVITQELSLASPMKRIIHGDVSCGKSILAFLSLIKVASSGKRALLMAPTETLIRQHYQSLTQWLKTIPVRLMLGGKRWEGPKDAPIILGTHALFYGKEPIKDLGLVIIDEQQRFGVLQRLALMKKSEDTTLCPHLLCLTATPIPRTFQRMMWGQMDVSILEKRPTRTPMKSYLISMEKIEGIREWMSSCLGRNERIYWVCPAIDDDEKGIYARASYWEKYFPKRIACLHGRMTPKQKQTVMDDFCKGVLPILITTTVIEVGVHVRQASTMIIEESPSFGLSQLHQLRGRVGRDDIPGHCFFLYTQPLSPPAFQRLDFIRKHHNGFEIAEKDWSMRGSGTLLGTAQSGQSNYKFLMPNAHAFLLEEAAIYADFLWHNHGYDADRWLMLFGYSSCDILQAD